MACALMSLLGVSSIKLIGSVDYIAAVYALTIVSFMAGVHWGMALDQQRTEWPVNLFWFFDGSCGAEYKYVTFKFIDFLW